MRPARAGRIGYSTSMRCGPRSSSSSCGDPGPAALISSRKALRPATTSIAALIRENKTFRITSDIQTGANLGMITMDAHLISLVNRQLVTPDEALEKAQDQIGMRGKLTQMGAQLKAI